MPINLCVTFRILRLIDSGLVSRWIAEQLPNGTACLAAPGSDTAPARRPLSLNDYFGLLSVAGVCESILKLLTDNVIVTGGP